jgi:hypothetical protein
MRAVKSYSNQSAPEQEDFFDASTVCRACQAAKKDPQHRVVECKWCYDKAEREAIKEHGGG